MYEYMILSMTNACALDVKEKQKDRESLTITFLENL